MNCERLRPPLACANSVPGVSGSFLVLSRISPLLLRPLPAVKSTNLCVSVRNPLSHDETREKIVFNPSAALEQEDGDREPAHHFRLKWDGSKKWATIVALDEAGSRSALKKRKGKGKKNDADVPRSVTPEDGGEYVPVLAMECRGLEPYAFHPLGNEFRVVSEGGVVFEEDVDLSDGDWGDYDEENDAAVGVNDFETKIISV